MMRRRPGFTLIEVLIAVAALSLIAVGLAAIFGTVRETIRGGTALSRLTAQANQIERQMREDFEAMTREGFFVISHEYALSDRNVAIPTVNELGASTRPRRVDQMIFFRTGEFTSARQALISGTTARSNVAMVYYGHGQRRAFDPTPGSLYREPELDDPNDVTAARLGSQLNVGSSPNPNRYAADWILLRHVTLLVPPESGLATLPVSNQFGLDPVELADHDLQVGVQPAASHVFRALQATIPDVPPIIVGRPAGVRPKLSSGLVDVATTSLEEIRAIVNTVGAQPNTITNQGDLDNALDGDFQSSDRPFMHAWMEDAFPALIGTSSPNSGYRLRCEPQPPDFFGALNATSNLEKAYRTADQSMLSASNIAPNCTEFIVQWTFGVLDQNSGELIWHDIDNPYMGASGVDLYELPYRDATPTSGFYGQFGTWPVNPNLIHDPQDPSQDTRRSYFGFVDPAFTPTDSATSTVPWAWPKLVRVTIRLADPSDRRVEETFQFVFETPGNPAP